MTEAEVSHLREEYDRAREETFAATDLIACTLRKEVEATRKKIREAHDNNLRSLYTAEGNAREAWQKAHADFYYDRRDGSDSWGRTQMVSGREK